MVLTLGLREISHCTQYLTVFPSLQDRRITFQLQPAKSRVYITLFTKINREICNKHCHLTYNYIYFRISEAFRVYFRSAMGVCAGAIGAATAWSEKTPTTRPRSKFTNNMLEKYFLNKNNINTTYIS